MLEAFTTIDYLPVEVLEEIFEYLDYDDLCSITLTRKEWQDNNIFRKRTRICVRQKQPAFNHVESRLRTISQTFLTSSRVYYHILFEDYRDWTIVQAIICKFGDFLKSLEISKTSNNIEEDRDLQFEHLSCFLFYTPNLEHLKFDYCLFYPEKEYLFPKLEKLSKISIDFIGHNYEPEIEPFLAEAIKTNWCNKLEEMVFDIFDRRIFELILEKSCKTIKAASLMSIELLQSPKLYELDLDRFEFCHQILKPEDEKLLFKFIGLQNSLKYLFLRYPINKELIENITSNIRHLKQLTLSLLTPLDGHLLSKLTVLTELQDLRFQCHSNPFTSFDFSSTALKCLVIENAGELTAECVVQITKQLPNLVTLRLDFCVGGVTDLSLTSICHNLVKLEELSIEHCELFSDDGLEELSNLTRLRSLNLNRCSLVSGDCLLAARLPNLQTLLLESTCEKIMPQNFESFSRNFPKLKCLKFLGNENVNDKAISVIARRLHYIEELYLEELPITNRSIDSIIKYCKRLKKLLIRECVRVSRKADFIHHHLKTTARVLLIEISDE